jgi:ribosomal protein L37AE/L43A
VFNVQKHILINNYNPNMNININNSSTVCCPKCESGHIRRVRRPLFVKQFLSFIPLRRYQCLSCLLTFAGPVTVKPSITSTMVVSRAAELSQPFAKQLVNN